MRRALIFILSFVLISGPCYGEPMVEISHFDFVYEFVQELVDTHHDEELVKLEMSTVMNDSSQAQTMLVSIIHNDTRTKTRLNVKVQRLQQILITDNRFDVLIPYLIEMYSRKEQFYGAMVAVAQSMLSGPKPDVNYGTLVARMQEVTAQVEFVDKSIFHIVPLLGTLLISQKPDSKGHLSHLSMTRKQALELVSILQSGFGGSLDEEEQNWTTSSAYFLRTYIRDKGYKYLDDPWE